MKTLAILVAGALVLGLIALVAAGYTGRARTRYSDLAPLPTATLVVEGKPSITVEALVATTPNARQRGLAGRTSLDAGSGMLFVFTQDVRYAVEARDVGIPLSVAFMDDQGRILEIIELEPFDTVARMPSHAYRYFLEVQRGWFATMGVEVGERFILPADVSREAE